MNTWTADFRGLLIVAAILLGVIVLNLAMLRALTRGDRQQREAAVWGQALSGGSDARRQQQAQLDELRRRVAGLPPQSPPPDEKPPAG